MSNQKKKGKGRGGEGEKGSATTALETFTKLEIGLMIVSIHFAKKQNSVFWSMECAN